MTRVKINVASRTRRKRILKLASGYRGPRGRLYRAAKDAVRHAMRYAYIHRRDRKGDFRRLWIARINAAARNLGLTYSRFIAGLKKHDVLLNRKVLAQIAVEHPVVFSKIVAEIKS
jgi:large subunit ribosomal protein L20